MTNVSDTDAALIQWGDRLFYPGNRIVKAQRQPALVGTLARQRAADIRARIHATVVRRAPQVMVKVTGGGRGMKAIAAHWRYISKNGRLEIEDEQGSTASGKEALRELAEDWKWGGTLIDDVGNRREAFNIMLSMPRGTDPLSVQRAAREFARIELADHKYVMVLHDHQANPHVHISVRAESRHGKRLNPRKTDLQRWRETFAEKLMGLGVDAEATRQAIRGSNRHHDALWRIKAREDGRLRIGRPNADFGNTVGGNRASGTAMWRELSLALGASPAKADRELARAAQQFVEDLEQPTSVGLHQHTEPAR